MKTNSPNILKAILIALPVIIFASCSVVIPVNELTCITPEKEPYLKSDTIKPESGYIVHDFILSDGKIIATDSQNDCLLIIDPESGATVAKGQSGNGNDDYLHPRGIWLNNDTVYVMDSGNGRIKILDLDLNFKKAIDVSGIKFHLPEYESFFDDISADDNGNVFFTVNTTRKSEARLYCIESGSDKPRVIMKACSGVVASYGDTTYFANTWEHPEDHSKITGNSRVYEIRECKYIVSYSLPYLYATAGICVSEGVIYCSSYGRQEVAKVDLDSLTAVSVFSEPIKDNAKNDELKRYGTVWRENGTVWLLEKNGNEIYKLTEG